MSDFEIISVVIMIISLVLNAIKLGRGGNNKKKKKSKQGRHPAPTGDGFALLIISEGRSHSKSVIPSCRYYITRTSRLSTANFRVA